MAMGVDHGRIMKTLHSDTLDILYKRADILHGAVRAMDGRVAYVIMGQKEIAEKDITYEDIHCISTILRDCDDIELGFTMYEEEDNRWRCSFRSDGKWINVNELLQAFCGGGHAAAAGVRKRTNDVDKFRQEILERIVMMRKISGQNKELETKHRRTRRCRMMEKERTYIAIDLKSFYASVECKERNRDPLTTNLVVADKSRTEKRSVLRYRQH